MTTPTPDLLDMLDALAADLPPGPTVTEVIEQANGHIVVWTDAPPRRSGKEYVAFLDMGPVLSLWTGQGVDLKPADARTLGAALIAWADRRDGLA